MGRGLSVKCFLRLQAPSEEDSRSAQVRILDALAKEGLEEPAAMSLAVMKKLSHVCETANWEITVFLCWDGGKWIVADVEAGDCSREHYGVAADLGSTTVVMELLDCTSGQVLARSGVQNRQREIGLEILSRIFYAKDQPEHLEELRRLTVDSICEGLEELAEESGIPMEKFGYLVISANNAMIHFLVGMDPFYIFASPYAVWADRIGFCQARELELPLKGWVYCVPAKANYLGGDILSGLIEVGIHKSFGIQLFFDVGTNGELVIGSRDFLICGAGAAGPALEGEAVKTGMRAVKGAVSQVKLENGEFLLTTVEDGEPRGICGSGIVSLISELYLCGWMNPKGKFLPEKSQKIAYQPEEREYAVLYGPGLWFYESDVEEFLKAKAAAYTMIRILLQEIGIGVEDVENFYMAGAFGTHIDKRSAVTVGMYPDISLERIHRVGNSSLKGAGKILLDKAKVEEIGEILSLMSYVQFGAVENFLHEMVAATAVPHTDIEKFPSVEKERQKRSKG